MEGRVSGSFQERGDRIDSQGDKVDPHHGKVKIAAAAGEVPNNYANHRVPRQL